MTPASRFHNALRILTSLDVADLRAAGVIDENWGTPGASDRPQLAAFVQDPIREVLRMPDDNFDRLFALIESRQPKENSSLRAALIAKLDAIGYGLLSGIPENWSVVLSDRQLADAAEAFGLDVAS